MLPRQARRERREAERKAKKLDLKKSRLADANPPAAPEIQPETHPEIQPRWNPELEDEFPRELQIRNNAVMDRRSLQAGLPIPPPGPAPTSVESLRAVAFAARKAAPKPTNQPEHPRAETNRANSQLSTGPRTTAGKLASSRNSFKHGLASGQLIIPGEDPAAFRIFSERPLNGAQGAAARRQTVEELAICSGGALDTEPVVRVFLNRTPPCHSYRRTARKGHSPIPLARPTRHPPPKRLLHRRRSQPKATRPLAPLPNHASARFLQSSGYTTQNAEDWLRFAARFKSPRKR